MWDSDRLVEGRKTFSMIPIARCWSYTCKETNADNNPQVLRNGMEASVYTCREYHVLSKVSQVHSHIKSYVESMNTISYPPIYRHIQRELYDLNLKPQSEMFCVLSDIPIPSIVRKGRSESIVANHSNSFEPVPSTVWWNGCYSQICSDMKMKTTHIYSEQV